MKKCFKCGERKPLSDFYKHKAMADGHVNKCKECNKRDVRENRARRVDYYREYDKVRGNRHPEGYSAEWRRSNPIKALAQTMIGNRVRDGKMVRPDSCEQCGSSSQVVHGHHDDYSRPLDVRWLCPSCHRKWHLEHGEGANAH